MSSNRGIFVISLDYELMWGCHDWSTVSGYGTTNIAKVGTVIQKLITLFKKYDIHATFASVGLIMCSNKEEALSHIPDKKPGYYHNQLSPYKQGFIEGIQPKDQDLFFSPETIEDLSKTEGIEIGSHTFSHFYCWEPGQTTEEFASDLQQAVGLAESKGHHLTSIVFPKNNVADEYIRTASQYGFLSYRGNPKHFYSNDNGLKLKSILNKLGRLSDTYIPLVDNSHSKEEMYAQEVPINIPASRFLRPYNKKLRILESLRLKRIRKEIILAARNNRIYHLWWHPHNFGNNTTENIEFLEQILKTYKDCHDRFGMTSKTMHELTQDILSNK